MTLATYLGLGLALAGTRLLSARVRGRPLPLDQPFDYLLAIPLVLTFALVLGVRAAFAVPADSSAPTGSSASPGRARLPRTRRPPSWPAG